MDRLCQAYILPFKYFLVIKYIKRGIDLHEISNIFYNITVQNLTAVYFDNIYPFVISYANKNIAETIDYTPVTSHVYIKENTLLPIVTFSARCLAECLFHFFVRTQVTDVFNEYKQTIL